MNILPGNALQNTAEYDRNTFFVSVGPDVSMEDVLTPRFWAHHVAKLKVNTKIEVVAEDGSFDLELRVVKTGVGYVHVRVLREWKRVSAPAAEQVPDVSETDIPEGYIVNHAPKTKWRFLTEEPKLEIARDFATKEHAIAAAIAHAKVSMQVAA